MLFEDTAALFGLVVGLFVVRYREIFFGMLNLAFSMVLWSLLEKMFHVTNGADREKRAAQWLQPAPPPPP